MGAAATIRIQVEATLAQRVPAALTLKIKQAPELFLTGVVEVDAMLGGGIPAQQHYGGERSGIDGQEFLCFVFVGKCHAARQRLRVGGRERRPLARIGGGGRRVELRRMLCLRMSAERRQKLSDKPWSRLEQALKATDLLLQTGGFAAIVLDMSDVLPQHAMRIPLATWYRFRLAAEHARTALVFLTQSPCASSCATLALRCDAAQTKPFSDHGETPLFERQQYQLLRERNRNEGSPFQRKKPVGRVSWAAETQWTRCR